MKLGNIFERRKISDRVWLSISILILAYCVTSIQSFFSKGIIQEKLYNIGVSSEQSTAAGQALQKNLNEQMKLYQEAVMISEKSLVDEAKSRSQSVHKTLDTLSTLQYNSLETTSKIHSLKARLIEYKRKARPVYISLAEGDDSEETFLQAAELAREKEVIWGEVTELTGMVAQDLTHALNSMSTSIERKKWIELSTLIGALLASIITITFVLNKFVTKPIKGVVRSLSSSADHVTSASAQVSTASQSLADGASQQAASIEETSSSLEEMSSVTRQNANNANQADSLMKEANQVVTQANNSMTNLTASMDEITRASEDTQKIIKTIDEIAFQTNLLALNAAVEAARAGEAGAGFAVVAEEVRNLAMRSADSAKNTESLIEGTVKKIKDGTELVNSTNDAFAKVASSSQKVGDLVGEIAAASNEQAQGIEQVNKTVAKMDKVTQQNAANAEESASASLQMNAQAEHMKDMVNGLQALVGENRREAGHTEIKGALFAVQEKQRRASEEDSADSRTSFAVPAKLYNGLDFSDH